MYQLDVENNDHVCFSQRQKCTDKLFKRMKKLKNGKSFIFLNNCKLDMCCYLLYCVLLYITSFRFAHGVNDYMMIYIIHHRIYCNLMRIFV